MGSAALVGWLLVHYDLGKVWEATRQAASWELLAVWAAAIVVVWVADSACLHVLFGRLGMRLRLRDVLAVKGASYFLNLVNYNAAAGGIGWAAGRLSGRGAWRGISALVLLNAVDLMGLVVYVTLGLATGATIDASVRAALVPLVAVAWVAYPAGMALAHVPWPGPLERIRRLAVLDALRRATFADHVVLLGIRVGFLALYLAVQWISLHAFGVPVPLHALMVYNAAITLVTALPISVAGIGSVQVAMVALYRPWASPERIVACGLAIAFLFAAIRTLIGYACLPAATRLMERSQAGREPNPPRA